MKVWEVGSCVCPRDPSFIYAFTRYRSTDDVCVTHAASSGGCSGPDRLWKLVELEARPVAIRLRCECTSRCSVHACITTESKAREDQQPTLSVSHQSTRRSAEAKARVRNQITFR